jgi:phage terminase large subunit GpA-like protein
MILTPYADMVMPMPERARQILCPAPRPLADEWMESGEYILPPNVSSVKGPYSFEYTPFLREPMRRCSRGPVKVGIEACIQIGKTLCLNGFFGYCVKYRLGPILLLMPRREDVERRINTRLVPMFVASPELMQEVPGGDVRNIHIGKETVFVNGVIAFLAWSGSSASLRDNPVMVAIIDEPGAFNIIQGTGEDPFDLVDNRQRSYPLEAITLYVTSPMNKDDLSDKQFRKGSDARLYVPCQMCGLWHAIGASEQTLIIGKDKNGQFFEPDDYTERDAPCWYQCPHCQKRWSETRRALAIAAGVWIHKTQQISPKGIISGAEPMTRHWTYRCNSMMIHPRFWNAKKEAAKFVTAMQEMKAGSIAALMDYRRSQQACPWEETITAISEDALVSRVLPELHRRCVPVAAKMLVASADYHEDFDGIRRIDFEVRALGLDLINWIIVAGSVSSWEELERELLLPFPWAQDCDDEELMVACVFADAGDKPDAVYMWCARHPGWAWPIKGIDKQRTPLVLSDMGKIHEQRMRRGQRRLASAEIEGQQLVLVDQSYFSELITSWVEPSKASTGETYFYAEILDNTKGRYFREFRGMHRVQEQRSGYRVWVWRTKGKNTPVHFHDVPRYSAAAAFFCKAHLLQSALRTEPPERPGAPLKLKRTLRTQY